MLAIWSLVPLPFLNPAWTSRTSQFTYYWSLDWKILSNGLLACEMSVIVQYFKLSSTLFSIFPWLTGYFYIFFCETFIKGFLSCPFWFFLFWLKYNSHTVKSTSLKCKIQWFFTYEDLYNHHYRFKFKIFLHTPSQKSQFICFSLAAFAFDVTFKKSLPKPMSKNVPLCFPLRDLQA